MVTATAERITNIPSETKAWAQDIVRFDELSHITDRPWAQTWRLDDSDARYYLKQLPPQQTQSLGALPLLHQQFPKVVPQVLGTDQRRGLLLLADHGGKTPNSGMDEAIRVRLLETYAKIQAEAVGNDALLSQLPDIDPAQTIERFFDYLDPNQEVPSSTAGANFYIGEAEAQSFFEVLTEHRTQLVQLLKRCGELPTTINHCDLRRSNMALDRSGRCLIYDWDESVAGPAGMSLHNFFKGCSRVPRILNGTYATAAASRKVRRMNGYVDQLVRHGYSDEHTLRRVLRATVCLGVLRYLQSYSAFPRDDQKYRRVVGDIHRDRLSDLVVLCEWLEANPDQWATTAAPVVRERRSGRDEIEELEAIARHPEAMPTLRFTREELERQEMSETKLKLGSRLFNEYGTLVIENAFDPDLVDELKEDYFRNYAKYSEHKSHEDALKVGSRRYMVTIELAGAFHSPAVYAPPLVLPVIQRILGEKMILGSITAVTSLGGSKDMHIHKDHPALFSRREVPYELPSFGVSMILPLLGFAEELGTTRVWKGSHKTSLKESLKTPHQDPYANKGSVLLMDYRLTHQGLANRTDQVRPILDIIYQRPWFRDIANYGQQSDLIMPEAAWEQVPAEHRELFEWARR